MSDYEVTLVNDNSTAFKRLLDLHLLTPLQCMICSLPCFRKLERWGSGLLIRVAHRQEFYVRFKGPEESELPSLAA